MVRNRDFAMLHAGRAAFGRNGGYAGAVAGWNGMHGVIPGADRGDGWQTWGADDTGVPEEEFMSYVYCNAGAPAEPDAHGNVQAARIRGKHGGMRLAGTGDGLENVSSKI